MNDSGSTLPAKVYEVMQKEMTLCTGIPLMESKAVWQILRTLVAEKGEGISFTHTDRKKIRLLSGIPSKKPPKLAIKQLDVCHLVRENLVAIHTAFTTILCEKFGTNDLKDKRGNLSRSVGSHIENFKSRLREKTKEYWNENPLPAPFDFLPEDRGFRGEAVEDYSPISYLATLCPKEIEAHWVALADSILAGGWRENMTNALPETWEFVTKSPLLRDKYRELLSCFFLGRTKESAIDNKILGWLLSKMLQPSLPVNSANEKG